MRPGDHRAVPVHLVGGEMLSLQLPPSPPPVSVTILPDRDTLQVPRLAMLRANCNGGFTTGPRGYWGFALPRAAGVAYPPKKEEPQGKGGGSIPRGPRKLPRP